MKTNHGVILNSYISRGEGAFLLVSSFLMLSWVMFNSFLATDEVFEATVRYSIDKYFHILGGAFVASVIFVFFGKRRFLNLILLILLAASAWEVIELLFEPRVISTFSRSRSLWLKDTVYDTLAAFFGAFLYWMRSERGVVEFMREETAREYFEAE